MVMFGLLGMYIHLQIFPQMCYLTRYYLPDRYEMPTTKKNTAAITGLSLFFFVSLLLLMSMNLHVPYSLFRLCQS